MLQQQQSSIVSPSKSPVVASRPVPLTADELSKVSGAGGPNGGWCGPNGGWL